MEQIFGKFCIESNVAQNLSLLERCSNMEELMQIHAQMFKTGLILDHISANKLLAFCTMPNSGNLVYAHRVFDNFERPNNVMFNTMIKGYSNSNNPEKSLHFYQQMVFDCVPLNAYTFPFILKACSKMSVLEETQQIHGHVVKYGFGTDTYAANSLLHAYAKAGSIDNARVLFDRICDRDVVSWNSLIDGYSKNGDMKTAFELFEKMPMRNVISWTTMVSGCVDAGMNNDALSLFNQMQISGVRPDKLVLASALSACADLGALEQGMWIDAYIEKHEIQIDPVLGCGLIDMFAKCGNLSKAVKVFAKMGKKTVPVWTAMINGFAMHGKGRDALNLFYQMQEKDLNPNSITFTAILNACSYAGLVNEGKNLFKSMSLKPSIEHYGCMIDLLGRAGLLREAEEVLDNMPFKPNAAILGALMKACSIHGDLELGKKVGNMLINVDPTHGGRYVQLASVHASAKEWDQAVKVRSEMKNQGVKKLQGCSAISVNGSVHEFVASEKISPKMEEIVKTWDQISERLKESAIFD